MELDELSRTFERMKGKVLSLNDELVELNTQRKSLELSRATHEKALEILKLVGIQTQQKLQYHISDIASMALEAVMDDPYELKVEFVERRNASECDIFFARDGEVLGNPLDESGGGAVDIAAFALRIASWSMMRPRPRATIILDEPFRFVSEKYQPKASQMIKEVSEKLGVQFIIVTHSKILASYADKTFEVEKVRKGKWKISKVTEV